MTEISNTVYRQLQKHLDKQPVGYPKTLTGVELKVLKHIFTPEEAVLALCLDYKFRPVSHVCQQLDDPEMTEAVVTKRLTDMAKKGGAGYRDQDGNPTFGLIPLVVGMYEGYLKRVTPAFMKDFRKYVGSLSFGYSFLSTSKVQMRTIPVEESVSPETKISQFDDVMTILDTSEGPFVVISCICRKTKKMEGDPCKATDRVETCLVVNGLAKNVILAEMGTELTRDEAKALIRKNTEDGLILQPSNFKNVDFICSCCGCCCGMLNVLTILPNPAGYWATNFYAKLDPNACTGCGLCAKKCQVDAISVQKKAGEKNSVRINLKKCLGCGNCVVACKFDGIHLVKKDTEIEPPQTHEDLYETIMQEKKGTWDTFKKVAGTLLGVSSNQDSKDV